MKKTSLLAALLVALGAALPVAQAADISFYGIMETSLNVQKYKGQSETIQLKSGDSAPARVGIRGKEDLGNGYKVRFTLENGFDSGTGQTIASFDNSKSLFSREASLGIITPYGEIGMGRFGSLSSGLGTYGLQYFSSPYGNGNGELGFGSVFMFVPRTNNTIAYVTPNFDGLDFRVLYSNGLVDESTDGFNKSTKYLGTGFKYVKGNFGGTIFYERIFWPDQLYTADGSAPDDMQSLTASANYLLSNGIKIYGGYQYYRNARVNYGMQTTSGNFPAWAGLKPDMADREVAKQGMEGHAFMASVAIPLWGGRIMPGIAYVTGTDKSRAGEPDFQRFVGGVMYDYKLSKSTTIWASSAFSRGFDLFDSKDKIMAAKDTTYEQYFNSQSFMTGIVFKF